MSFVFFPTINIQYEYYKKNYLLNYFVIHQTIRIEFKNVQKTSRTKTNEIVKKKYNLLIRY